MIFSTVNKTPAFVLDKLGILFRLLKERKSEYEAFAGKIKNKEINRTVLMLAQETNQYAIELSSQIETMGGSIHNNDMEKAPENNILIWDEHDILKSCGISEEKMINAYRTILNEPFLHENLRRPLRCQLNGLIYAFMQLRLLNTSFHR